VFAVSLDKRLEEGVVINKISESSVYGRLAASTVGRPRAKNEIS